MQTKLCCKNRKQWRLVRKYKGNIWRRKGEIKVGLMWGDLCVHILLYICASFICVSYCIFKDIMHIRIYLCIQMA